MNNFKTNKWLGIAVLLLLLINAITLAILWKQKDTMPKGIEHKPQSAIFEFICNELSFDSVQVKAYEKLRDEHRNRQKEYQDKVRGAKDAFYSLMQTQHVEDSVIKMANKKVADAIGEFELYNYKHFEKVRTLCHENQKKKFDGIIKEVLNKMGNTRRMPPPNGAGEHHLPPPPPDGEFPPKH